MGSKKKIGTITFHASYNYGSALQAYALQKFLTNTFDDKIDYKIINLRTARQKSLYNRPYGCYDIRSNLRKIAFLGYKKQFQKRSEHFEDFIQKYLNVTEEYNTLEDLKKANLDFDYYICGSDQIWNYKILDFDWAFFLEFAKRGKKISYAASFGPEELSPDSSDKKRLRRDLLKFDSLSVRETGSLKNLEKIIGKSDASIHVDPTMLVDAGDWKKIAGNRLLTGDYIFMYDLRSKKNTYEIAKRLSELYNMPVVMVKEKAKMHLLFHNFIKKYDAGPIEFLNYIKYAKLVVSSTFHGNVFAIIFERPFIAVDGKKDLRISNLLDKAGLSNHSISSTDELNEKNGNLFNVDFSVSKKVLAEERERSKTYLKNALEIGER